MDSIEFSLQFESRTVSSIINLQNVILYLSANQSENSLGSLLVTSKSRDNTLFKKPLLPAISPVKRKSPTFTAMPKKVRHKVTGSGKVRTRTKHLFEDNVSCSSAPLPALFLFGSE